MSTPRTVTTGPQGQVVIATAGGLKGDVERPVGALKVPHLRSAERGSVVGEGEAFWLGVGADPSAQFPESGREPLEVCRGRWLG